MPYAVMIKTSARKRLSTKRLIWVKDADCSEYVSLSERGTWPTAEEAAKAITEDWEIVVEVPETEEPAKSRLKKAKAEPKQTPIAWYVTGTNTMLSEKEAKAEARRLGAFAMAVPLYTSPFES